MMILSFFKTRYNNNHVSPTEIESILHEHPSVNDCFVFGRMCDEVQELISAVVVKDPSFKVNTYLSIHNGISI